MTADRQLDAVLLRKPPLWRRVTPHRLGFLLALVLTLPWAVDVTRTHMIRSILRDASDETTFVVYGGMERYSAMDAVSRTVLRTVSELAPDADWTLQAGCGLLGSCACGSPPSGATATGAVEGMCSRSKTPARWRSA